MANETRVPSVGPAGSHPSQQLSAATHQATASAVAAYRALRQEHGQNASYGFMDRMIELAQQRDVREITQAYSNTRSMLASFGERVEESVVQARRAGFEDMRQELFRMGVRQGLGPEGANRYAMPSAQAHLQQRHTALGRMRTAIQYEVGRQVRLAKSRGKEVRVLDLLTAAERALVTQDYRAERIARTETHIGYNQARYAMLRELGPRNGLVQRWTERIDDKGKALDNKVAPDSFAMHGIVSAPGGMFTIPNDDRIPAARHGKKIRFPPLRPNDRAVLTPALANQTPRGT